MLAVESEEIKGVKTYLEGILNEQGQQIKVLQHRMEEDRKQHRAVEEQLRRERQEWKDKEKSFNKKIKNLQQNSGLKQPKTLEEDDEVTKLEKEAEEKQRFIKSLMSSLSAERSKTKELEQRLLQSESTSTEVELPAKDSQHVTPVPTASTCEDKDNSKLSESSTSGSFVEDLSHLFARENLETTEVLFDSSKVTTLDTCSTSEVYFRKYLEAIYPQCFKCQRILGDRVVSTLTDKEYCLECAQKSLNIQVGTNFFGEVLKDPIAPPTPDNEEEEEEQAQEKVQLRIESMPLRLKQLVRKLSMRNVSCEMCSLAATQYAAYYCIPCCAKVCNKCSELHAETSSDTPVHLLLNIERPILYYGISEDGLCDIHQDKHYQSFCSNCNILFCEDCSVSHKGHRTMKIADQAYLLKTKFDEALSGVDKVLSALKNASGGFKSMQENGQQRKNRIKDEIQLSVWMLRDWIDSQANDLLRELDYISELNSVRLVRFSTEMDTLYQELRHFRLFVDEFLEEPQDSDLACFGTDIFTRVLELNNSGKNKLNEFEKMGFLKEGYVQNPISISFTPLQPRSFMAQAELRNFVGTLTTKSVEAIVSHAILRHSIEPELYENGDKEVCGLTTLGKELFLATRQGQNSFIAVFDLQNFQPKRQMTGLRNISDIASCSEKNCLYAYGDMNDTRGVLVMDQTGILVDCWPVNYKSGSLSLTVDTGEVVVTGCNTNKLSEYSSDGYPKHMISMDAISGVLHLWHSLKMDADHFIVSHGIANDAMHGVCIIDTDGHVLRTLEGGRTVLDIPMYLAYGEMGTVFIADLNNMRVLEVNSVLEVRKEIVSKSDGLKWPHRIYFDVAKKQLFIASSKFLESLEILVFDVNYF